jgi:hypothetical protein
MNLKAVCSSVDLATTGRGLPMINNPNSNNWKNPKFNTITAYLYIIQQESFKLEIPEGDIHHCDECHSKTQSNALHQLFNIISINM